ncbi:MAG TPA: DUF192 domain-containing protein [Candidatus Baltobacteraceae bacterium]
MIFSTLAFAIALGATAAPMPTPQSLAVITVKAPKAALRVQIARTEPQRERGLMAVRHLSLHTGMLFVFDDDGPVAFWMKDTLIPLDMVFLAPDGTVRKVFARVPVLAPQVPDEEIPLEQASAKFVIELPSGEAAADGLRQGARVTGLPTR